MRVLLVQWPRCCDAAVKPSFAKNFTGYQSAIMWSSSSVSLLAMPSAQVHWNILIPISAVNNHHRLCNPKQLHSCINRMLYRTPARTHFPLLFLLSRKGSFFQKNANSGRHNSTKITYSRKFTTKIPSTGCLVSISTIRINSVIPQACTLHTRNLHKVRMSRIDNTAIMLPGLSCSERITINYWVRWH